MGWVLIFGSNTMHWLDLVASSRPHYDTLTIMVELYMAVSEILMLVAIYWSKDNGLLKYKKIRIKIEQKCCD